MVHKLSLKDLLINGKKVLVRVDFNVPLDKSGQVADNTRIKESLPTIKYILDKGGIPLLMSHLGRPAGKVNPEFSLAPCAKELSKLLGKPVRMANDCVGKEVKKQVSELHSGDIFLLENLRFHEAEEKPEKDPLFAHQLAELGDMYVNDAFGTSHRAHSSIVPLAKLFPKNAAAGFLLEKEINFLGKALSNPEKPFLAIIGGAKVSTKLGVIQALLKKVDILLIGGGMAFTFLKAQGYAIGKSLCEEKMLSEAKDILALPESKKMLLPLDALAVEEISNESKTHTYECSQGIPENRQGVDIGPKTVALFEKEILKAKTILWNGPLGIFEIPAFAKGTLAIAKAVGNAKALTIAGGGETIAAIKESGLADRFTHLSTGGGATLEYIEFGTLPGIEALSDTV